MSLEPERALFIAESQKVSNGYRGRHGADLASMEEKWLPSMGTAHPSAWKSGRAAGRARPRCRCSSRLGDELERLTGFRLTRGASGASPSPPPLPTVAECCTRRGWWRCLKTSRTTNVGPSLRSAQRPLGWMPCSRQPACYTCCPAAPCACLWANLAPSAVDPYWRRERAKPF